MNLFSKLLGSFVLGVFAMLSCIIAFDTHGQEISHINVGRIVIDSQATSSQKKAGEQAFKQVLVKMSGYPSALDNDVLKKTAQNFEQYLISSSFIKVQEQLVYQASFNQQKMMDLLKFSEMPIWGARRPNTLLWLAVEDDTKTKQLITQTQPLTLASLVSSAAYQRGLEINIPLGDLEDSSQVNIFDVWGLFASSIKNHSARYATQYTVVSRVALGFDEFTSSEAYIAEWVFMGNDKVLSGKSAGVSQQDAIVAMINDYADFLASQYAISAEQFNQVRSFPVVISGVTSLKTYASVLDSLSSIALVNDVNLVQQSKDTLVFEVTASADQEILATIFTLDKRFRLSDSFGVLPNQSKLHYRWVGL